MKMHHYQEAAPNKTRMTPTGFEPTHKSAENVGVSEKSGAPNGARPELSTDSTSDPAAGGPASLDPLVDALDRLRATLTSLDPTDALTIVQQAQALARLSPEARKAIVESFQAADGEGESQ